MGSGQSTVSCHDEQVKILTEQLAKKINIENNGVPGWCPSAVLGIIINNKRPDGSTVRELFVPVWKVAFFESNGIINVREEGSILFGKPVNISEPDAILLLNLYLKHVAFIDASASLAGSSSFIKLCGEPEPKI
jgi:hypothetical protein